jgi:peptidoglycan/LPS O-acetylase OafA/YrhL
VLSGYLITGVLLADRGAPLGPYLRRFYWRRTLRIFPLYYGYLLVLTAVFLAAGRPHDFGGAAGWLFSYTYNFTRIRPDWDASPFFTHFWSLAVEEQFYLAWPLVVHALGRRGLAVVAAAMVVLAPAFRAGLALGLAGGARTAYDIGDTVYWFPLSHADAFATGALAALFRLGDVIRRPALVAASALGLLAAAGAAHLAALEAAGAELPMGTMGFPLASIDNGFHVWGYSLLNVASVALVGAAVAAHRVGGAMNALAAAPLAGLGRISYGVYVLHWPLLALFNAHVRYRAMTVRGALLCAAWFLLVCGAAWVSHRFFESRFLALKDRGAGLARGLRAA